jgi:hypothetical protein
MVPDTNTDVNQLKIVTEAIRWKGMYQERVTAMTYQLKL